MHKYGLKMIYLNVLNSSDSADNWQCFLFGCFVLFNFALGGISG